MSTLKIIKYDCPIYDKQGNIVETQVKESRHCYAPFTEEEVISLNGYQMSGVMHPFTCAEGRGFDPEREHPGHISLVATTDGWRCPFCDYRQDWAHEFMTNGKWKEIYLEKDKIFNHVDFTQSQIEKNMKNNCN